MAKRNAIVRVLSLVETIDCTSVICSDKTGTLKTIQISVSKMFVVDGASGDNVTVNEFIISESTYEPFGQVSKDGKNIKCEEYSALV
uniref:Calcium-transporting ATPase n=1 Tax=Strongyloides venezuelensis TaxID=75913 RepID=A0A0K0G1U9_STRVS